jgi:putative membrane protein
MIVLALVFASLAALIHVYIFWLESFAWTTPRGLATFGMSADQAGATKELAFNQGFYNLFLAVVTAAGVVTTAVGHQGPGAALLIAGCGSMLAAGLVLLISSPSKARAALVQLVAPALALLFLGIGALT